MLAQRCSQAFNKNKLFEYLRFFLALSLGLALLSCRPKLSEEAGLLAIQKKSKQAPMDGLSHIEKAQVFAALNDATYCGADANCSVLERYERNRRFIGVNFRLDDWQMEFISARDNDKDMEGYVIFLPDQQDVIITVRGSETLEPGALQDWLGTNIREYPAYYAGKHIRGNVHHGFLQGMYGLWHPNNTGLLKVLTDFNLWNRRFWITGYSMGAAVATLVGVRLNDEDKNIGGIYTFGSPKLAQYDFQASFNNRLNHVTHNFANDKDPFPRIGLNFVAVGKTYLFDGTSLRLMDKDGVPDWGMLNSVFRGDIRAHLMNFDLEQGYLNAARLYQ